MKRRGPVHFYDLEARRWSVPLAAGAILADGTRWYAEGPTCWRELAALMLATGGTWVAHYGGGYDHLLMMKYLGGVAKVLVTGSRMLMCEMQCGIVLIDSFPGWLCGLAEIGKFIGLPKLDYDRSRLAELTYEERRAYTMRDVEILKGGWELADAVSERLGMRRKMTAGAAALEALRVLEPETWDAFESFPVSVDTYIESQGVAPGGRTEIRYRGEVRDVYCYDIKSSYPARYLDPNGMCAGMIRCSHPEKEWNNPHAVLKVMFDRPRSNRVAPVLSHGGFGAGKNLAAWVVYDERKLLDEDSLTENVRVVDGYIPEAVLPNVCKVFTNTLFRFKAEGIPFVKVWYNSLHGKYAEKPVKDTWESQFPQSCFMPEANPPKRYACGLWRFNTLDVDERGFCRPHVQPINAALVYGRARAHITRMIRDIENAGFVVYYTDTDSIFTNATPTDIARILRPEEVGNGLGQLAYEGGPFRGWILGRKMYFLESEDGKIKSAAKGISLSSMKHAKKRGDVFVESRSKFGSDLRRRIFEEAAASDALIMRTGITPFVTGANKEGWERFRMTRRVRETDGAKDFIDGVGWYREFGTSSNRIAGA